MMAFSYEWHKHPILFNTQERLQVQGQGNAAMCLALQQAKEELSDTLGMDSECLHEFDVVQKSEHKQQQ